MKGKEVCLDWGKVSKEEDQFQITSSELKTLPISKTTLRNEHKEFKRNLIIGQTFLLADSPPA